MCAFHPIAANSFNLGFTKIFLNISMNTCKSRKDIYDSRRVFKNRARSKDTLTNPQLIIEVLSDSTEAYDRGKKFALYRQIESLKEYILVSQSNKKIEKFEKNDTGFWTLSETNSDNDILYLSVIGCQLSVEDVYSNVEF